MSALSVTLGDAFKGQEIFFGSSEDQKFSAHIASCYLY